MASVDIESSTNKDGQREPEETSAPQPKISRFSWDASVAATPYGLGWDAEPVVLSWTNSKDQDLLVTTGGGHRGWATRLYQRVADGDGQLVFDAGTPIEALAGLRCISPIPNGSPSRFDLVALGLQGLVLLPNVGEGDQPQWGEPKSLGLPPDLGLGSCRIVQLVPLDWDGDGLVDLLIGVDDLTGYWPDSEQVPEAQQVGFNQKGGHPGYDRNGRWRGQAPRGRLFWLRNVGKVGAPAFELQPEIEGDEGVLDLGLHPAALTVSWGGGGSVELLATDDRGDVRIYRNFGGQRPPVLMEPRTLQSGHGPLLLPDDRTSVIAADIDKNGRPELVYGRSDGRVFAIHSGATRNDAKAPVPVLHANAPLAFGGHSVITAGDLDADGDLDIVFGDASGRLYLAEDLGDATDHRYAAPVELEAGGAPFRLEPGPDGMLEGPVAHRLGFASPSLVDWSGNGRLSLIVGGAGGEVVLLKNDGALNAPRFGAPSLLRSQGGPLVIPPRVRPAAAHWSGGDTMELIALDLQGNLSLYPRVENLEFGAPIPLVDRLGRLLRLDGGYGLAGRCSLWAGRWTGKETQDLLVGLPRGNRHVIPSLTGVPLDDVNTLPTILLLENLGHGRVIPRPLYHSDGRPVVVGTDGCSPMGIDGRGDGAFDLLVGSDDGTITLISRDDLRW